ncbi:hypothetical protein D3C77_285380 [compost metagenome]
MFTSSLFQVEMDVDISSDGVAHMAISCLQWRAPNLELLEIAAKQTFALMWYGTLDEEVLNVLEKAHLHGSLAPVKLIAVHVDELHFFLAGEVSSKTLPAIEALWQKVKDAAGIQSWSVHFSDVGEMEADQSDDDFCTTAKELLKIYDLGLVDYDSGAQMHTIMANCVASKTDVSWRYLPKFVLYELEIRQPHDQVVEAAEASKSEGIVSSAQSDEGEQTDYVIKVGPQTLCMLELMTARVRPHELRNMRVGINVVLAEMGLRMERSKPRVPVQAPLGHEVKGRLLAYIKAGGLMEGDYLFPSKRAPIQEMRASELVAIRQLWHLAHATFHQTRLDRLVPKLEMLTRHNQSAVLEHYVKRGC